MSSAAMSCSAKESALAVKSPTDNAPNSLSAKPTDWALLKMRRTSACEILLSWSRSRSLKNAVVEDAPRSISCLNLHKLKNPSTATSRDLPMFTVGVPITPAGFCMSNKQSKISSNSSELSRGPGASFWCGFSAKSRSAFNLFCTSCTNSSFVSSLIGVVARGWSLLMNCSDALVRLRSLFAMFRRGVFVPLGEGAAGGGVMSRDESGIMDADLVVLARGCTVSDTGITRPVWPLCMSAGAGGGEGDLASASKPTSNASAGSRCQPPCRPFFSSTLQGPVKYPSLPRT
mmetsp:Transcript_36570/g.84065  ORF Transcript_36570/g.84065 Transcript_36570/m.84065 type:complete len:288 (+) Transcript_36570:6382-7245(+)